MDAIQTSNLAQILTMGAAISSTDDAQKASDSLESAFNKILENDLDEEKNKKAQNSAVDSQTTVSQQILAMMEQVSGFTPAQKQELAQKLASCLVEMVKQGKAQIAINALNQLTQAKTSQDVEKIIAQLTSQLSPAAGSGDQGENNIAGVKPLDPGLDKNQNTSLAQNILDNAFNDQDTVVKIVEKTLNDQNLDKLPKQSLKDLVQAQTDPQVKQIMEKIVSLVASPKISLNAVSLPAQPAPQVSLGQMQTRVELITQIKDAVSRMEIRQAAGNWLSNLELNHRTLGTTKLNLEMVEGNKIKLEIVVGKNESRDILNNSFSDLKHMFEDKGLSLSSCNVDVDPNLLTNQGFLNQDMFTGQGADKQGVNLDQESLDRLGQVTSQAQYQEDYLDADRVNCTA